MLGAGLALAPFSRVLGANDEVRLAIIGVGSTVKGGGKGKQDIRDFQKVPGVRVVALCDPDSAILGPELERLRAADRQVQGYADIRKVLDNKDIDVISVTPPNHWHALAAVWGCQAGKDVFVQKPACHTIFEGRKMVEAARKYNRIVQCTSNSRAPTGFREAMEYAWQGNLGKPLFVHGVDYNARISIGKVAGPQPVPKSVDYDLWCGPAPMAPVMRECFHYDWHWQWAYGDGDIGNMGIHPLDGCRMAARQNRLPRNAISLGGRFAYTDDGQTPNSQLVLYDYDPVPIIFEVRGLPKDKSLLAGPWNKNYKETMDTYCGVRIAVVLHCENGYVAHNQAFDNDGKLIRKFPPNGPTEQANFIQAVRSRKVSDLVGDVEDGHLSAALIHMANISYRVGKSAPSGEIKERIRGHKELSRAYGPFEEHLSANGVGLDKMVFGPMLTMDTASERFTGEFSAEANRLLTRDYRTPFVVPEKV